MRFRFHICDVFTEDRFGGNQLAVLPEADGLTGSQMQQIAREFNFSESAFVLAPRNGHTRRVRIFTPAREVPFAGHPNVGTAFTLAMTGALGEFEGEATVTFEEQAGVVPVRVERRQGGRIWCEVAAPERLSMGPQVLARALAAAVSLAEKDVVCSTHPPRVASVGLPFLMAELIDVDALARARPDVAALERMAGEGIAPDVHLYIRQEEGRTLRARMFAPLDGVPEDPATGSANCALAAFLAHLDSRAEGAFSWRVTQGVEMGRPSVLDVRAEKRQGAVAEATVGGACVMVAEGSIEVDGEG